MTKSVVSVDAIRSVEQRLPDVLIVQPGEVLVDLFATPALGEDVEDSLHRDPRLAPGAYADIIAVDGNLLRNIHLLHDVPFVMKNGEVVKERRVRAMTRE